MDLIHDFMFGWIFREIKKLYFNLHDDFSWNHLLRTKNTNYMEKKAKLSGNKDIIQMRQSV